jgi:hypothetical protein
MGLSDEAIRSWHELGGARRRVARMLGNWPEHQETFVAVIDLLNEAAKLIDPLCKEPEDTQ